MSADGRYLIGQTAVASPFPGIRERATRIEHGSSEVLTYGTLGGLGSTATGISADGRTIVGTSQRAGTGTGTHAFRTTSSGLLQDLGTLGDSDSAAAAISRDGSVIVGNSYNISTVSGRAFRWDQTRGMSEITGPNVTSTIIRGLDADGEVAVGRARFGTSMTYTACRWTLGGEMQNLGTLPGAPAFSESRATCVSDNGEVVAGFSAVGTTTHAFRWTQTSGMEDLGVIGDWRFTQALAMNASGSIIGGTMQSSSPDEAMIWSRQTGMLNLNTFLPTLGVDLTGWRLATVDAISADGTSIAGYGSFNGTAATYWIHGLPPIPSPHGLLPVAAGIWIVRRRRHRA